MVVVEITKQMEMVLYHSEQSDITVNAIIKDETIWITQKAMAELFGIDKSGISRHLSNIFKSGELDEEVVVAKIATTTQHGAIEGKTQSSLTRNYGCQAPKNNYKLYKINFMNVDLYYDFSWNGGSKLNSL